MKKKNKYNYIEEHALTYALGKAKALLKLFKYKKGSLEVLLKNQKISQKEYLDKIKSLKDEVIDNFYKIQYMVDPTTAAGLDKIIHMIH